MPRQRNLARRWRCSCPHLWNWFVPVALIVLGGSSNSHGADDVDLFADGVVAHLAIEIPPEGMRTLRNYHQVWGQPRPERIDVKATVRDGDSVFTNVAIHLKGSYTFQPVDEKPSLTLNFDKFAPGQSYRGFDKIHLNNSVQDPSYLCEKLARELFIAAGVPAARAGHARVTLNGRALGFYVLVEGYNKRFVKRHFKSAQGNLYDGGSGGDITKALEVDSGDDRENRSDLAALLEAARETDASARFVRLQQRLDVERFLAFAAIEVLLQHWDGYCLGPNNYRLFHDSSRDRMVFMPHGLDQILGVGLSPPRTITPQFDGVVARGLLGTPEGRRRYLERLGEVFTNQFRADSWIDRIDRLSKAIRPFAASGLLDQIRFQSAVENLKTRVTRREREVRDQLENPERPLVLDDQGLARLSGWRFKGPNRGGMRSKRSRADGREILEVHAEGPWGAGSWRKLVLLEAGRYEFSAVARTVDVPAGATNSGVILRVSGERDSAGLRMDSAWTPLSYEFEVPGIINVELVCEFRGAAGAGMFDASSLTLRRKEPPAGR